MVCMIYISQLSRSEMWLQGHSGGSAGRPGGVFELLWQGHPSNGFDLVGWLQYLLCRWLINISLWSPQGQDILPRESFLWSEAMKVRSARFLHTCTHTSYNRLSNSLSHSHTHLSAAHQSQISPDQVNRSTSHKITP